MHLIKSSEGKDTYMISSKNVIAGFQNKLCKNNIRCNSFQQFSSLTYGSSELHNENLALYSEYFLNMHEDMLIQLSDLLMMDIPTWISIPSNINVANTDISSQESFIELKNYEIMYAKFKDQHNMGNK